MTKVHASQRIEGLDFARALAMFGMLVVNFGVITGAEGNGPTWLIGVQSLFQGRASAIFVILAGIGIALMTAKARATESPSLIQQNRKTLWKRSLFLFVLGMVLYAVGWSGDILHYYGVYMLIASFFIVSSNKTILLLTSVLLVTAQTFQVIFNYMAGWNPQQFLLEYLDFWTLEGFLRNLFFNGYHPVLPWICFFFIGLVLGRFDLTKDTIRKKLLIAGLAITVVTEVMSKVLMNVTTKSVLDADSAWFLFETGPIPPNVFYIVSNTATALIVIVVSIYIAEKFAENGLIRAIIHTGQLTLTHYVSHVFIGIGILIVLNRLEHQTIAFSLLFSCLFFVGSMLFSVLWRRKYNRGPMEIIMRKVTK
ncbi:hypothetical protein H131_10393 [Lysinibacillus sphaericus OT4b.31]|uniref:DUF418 domain-containing protein n=1 Tax=Lysinibacillus sphaericus OT4b.31 TaxID=1285586 RepID=R7ZEJ4_LYSSH|nr:hypothetical protein H131_10393 [Lysinibacillus sphaericus OT4b.31]